MGEDGGKLMVFTEIFVVQGNRENGDSGSDCAATSLVRPFPVWDLKRCAEGTVLVVVEQLVHMRKKCCK